MILSKSLVRTKCTTFARSRGRIWDYLNSGRSALLTASFRVEVVTLLVADIERSSNLARVVAIHVVDKLH